MVNVDIQLVKKTVVIKPSWHKRKQTNKKTQILNRNVRGWSSDQTGERVKQQKSEVGVRVTRIHSMRLWKVNKFNKCFKGK